jgi:hypothetical protein
MISVKVFNASDQETAPGELGEIYVKWVHFQWVHACCVQYALYWYFVVILVLNDNNKNVLAFLLGKLNMKYNVYKGRS